MARSALWARREKIRREGERAQIGLAVTLVEGIPVFHKIFDGNIHNSKTFQDMITSFGQYDFKINGVTNLQPIRYWPSNRVKAHVFVCYLSCLLLSLLKYRLGKIGISAEDALRELATVYKVYLRDTKNVFKLSRGVSLTKKQELILKTLDKKLLKL
jgi:transposase